MDNIIKPKKNLNLYKALEIGYLRDEKKQKKRLKRFGYKLVPDLTTKEHLVAATESYVSGESIEGHTGFAPTANQTYHRFQIAKGAGVGTQILKDLKRIFGLDYVEKTVDMLNAYGVSIVPFEALLITRLIDSLI